MESARAFGVFRCSEPTVHTSAIFLEWLVDDECCYFPEVTSQLRYNKMLRTEALPFVDGEWKRYNGVLLKRGITLDAALDRASKDKTRQYQGQLTTSDDESRPLKRKRIKSTRFNDYVNYSSDSSNEPSVLSAPPSSPPSISIISTGSAAKMSNSKNRWHKNDSSNMLESTSTSKLYDLNALDSPKRAIFTDNVKTSIASSSCIPVMVGKGKKSAKSPSVQSASCPYELPIESAAVQCPRINVEDPTVQHFTSLHSSIGTDTLVSEEAATGSTVSCNSILGSRPSAVSKIPIPEPTLVVSKNAEDVGMKASTKAKDMSNGEFQEFVATKLTLILAALGIDKTAKKHKKGETEEEMSEKLDPVLESLPLQTVTELENLNVKLTKIDFRRLWTTRFVKSLETSNLRSLGTSIAGAKAMESLLSNDLRIELVFTGLKVGSKPRPAFEKMLLYTVMKDVMKSVGHKDEAAVRKSFQRSLYNANDSNTRSLREAKKQDKPSDFTS